MLPTTPIFRLGELRKAHGFSGIPVTETGEIGGKLLGLVTQRDYDFIDADKLTTPVSEVRQNRVTPTIRISNRVTCVLLTVCLFFRLGPEYRTVSMVVDHSSYLLYIFMPKGKL